MWANAIATPTIFLVPGVFGFLAWELKENWRLYAANRPRDLKPLVVGHHGETITEFLHPGFRSGTLPKLYARLRKASRRGIHTGRLRSSARQAKELAGVEEHLRRFVQRNFLMLLCASRGWQANPLVCGEIQLGTNRILVELYAAEMRGPSVWISLEDQAGWLVASIDRRGWLDQLVARPARHAGQRTGRLLQIGRRRPGPRTARRPLAARDRNLLDRAAWAGRPLGPPRSSRSCLRRCPIGRRPPRGSARGRWKAGIRAGRS